MESLENVLLAETCSLGELCTEIGKLFCVNGTEIGLLRAEGHFLKFIYPPQLQVAGTIPLSSNAVAARTATTKQSELFNNFPNVPHHTVFELVRLSDPDAIPDPAHTQMRIQKLMSAPILGEADQLLGVIQVSRKGLSPRTAGPDFTDRELLTLEEAGQRIAVLRPSLLHNVVKEPRFRLALENDHKNTKSKVAKTWAVE